MDVSGARGQMTEGTETARSRKGPWETRKAWSRPQCGRAESGHVYHKRSPGSHIQHPYSALPTHSVSKCI